MFYKIKYHINEVKTIYTDTNHFNFQDSPRCCVPTCKSGKTGLKTTYRFFKPPVNKILYKKWEYVFKQAKQELTPELQICELHFRTGLIYKRGIDKFGKVLWALRDGALPKLTASSGLLRLGGVPPSTTVQVPKKPESLIKTATSPTKSVSPSATGKNTYKIILGNLGFLLYSLCLFSTKLHLFKPTPITIYITINGPLNKTNLLNHIN